MSSFSLLPAHHWCRAIDCHIVFVWHWQWKIEWVHYILMAFSESNGTDRAVPLGWKWVWNFVSIKCTYCDKKSIGIQLCHGHPWHVVSEDLTWTRLETAKFNGFGTKISSKTPSYPVNFWAEIAFTLELNLHSFKWIFVNSASSCKNEPAAVCASTIAI